MRTFPLGVARQCVADLELPGDPVGGQPVHLAVHRQVRQARSARFRGAYSAIGLSPDCGLTWTLPRLVGRARAADLMLTNRPVDAAEAASIGLAARVVADDRLVDQARAVAAELASGPTAAFGSIKRLLDAGDRSTLAEDLGAEAASIAACANHLEGRAGVAPSRQAASPPSTSPA